MMHQGRWQIFILQLGAIASVSFCLTACLNLATTGAQAIYNHRNLQKNFNDNYITMKIEQQIQTDTKFKDTNISVATYHGKVLLAGQVPHRSQRADIQLIATDVPGVKRIYNVLSVSHPVPLLKKISDIWITTKIKSKLIASNDVDASDIKVVTENGTVFLMGTLLKEEAEAAVEIASETKGVENVVKILSYLQVVPNE